MKLYCMRHGEAAFGLPDAERPLTKNGEQALELLAKKLSDQGIVIDHILHSPKVRTTQTANIIAKAVKPEIIKATPLLLYDAGTTPILEMIESFEHDTLLVSHFPFIDTIVETLSDESIRFSPGTLVCLEKQPDGWEVKWTVYQ